MTIYEVLDIFRKGSYTERLKGEKFEKLMQRWLLADPIQSQKYTKVWMWNEFPARQDFGGADLGIDLVAKDINGGYVAIQCKCYDEQTRITMGMVSNFIATSSKTFKDPDTFKTVAFTGRVWISTTNKYGKNAEQAFVNQVPSVEIINLNNLDNSQVDWELLVNGKNGNEALRKKALPRDYQEDIIVSAIKHFKTNERGTLVMACGTGKTLTSMFITQKMLNNKGLVLFLAPSIALVGQSLNSWFGNSEKPIKAICICSDTSAGTLFGKDDDNEEDYMIEDLNDLPIKSCTDSQKVVEEIERYKNHDGLIVCFSTYQSIDVVNKAQKALIKKYGNFGVFDFVICDEAHRTASVLQSDKKESDFTKIHDGNFIQATHRMYMTATPKVYNEGSKSKAALKSDTLFSMDNEDFFGKNFYTLGFGTAVQKGLLTDYKVLVLTIDPSQASNEYLEAFKHFVQANSDKEWVNHITPEQQAMILGSVSALSKQVLFCNKDDFAEDQDLKKPMHTAIAFCDNVQRYIGRTKAGVYVANEIDQAFEEVTKVYKDVLSNDENDKEFIENLVDVKATYVSGSMNTHVRNENLDILREKDIPEKQCNIVCNVNCLSEGVDVPALDAAIFLASKKSMITIVQSVGRVMRKFAGKKYGYIIIPMIVPINADPETELKNDAKYKMVYDILNAMRSHDERLAAELSNHNYNHVKIVSPTGPHHYGGNHSGNGGNGGSRNGGDLLPFPLEFTDKLYARMVDKVGEKMYWEKWSSKVGTVAHNFIERIRDLVNKGKYVEEMDKFVKSLQKNINPSVDREQAITFLAQQMITQPVFDALFPSYDITRNNTVSKSMSKMLSLLQDEAFSDDKQVLDSFYDNVKQVTGALKTLEEKQDTIKTLYDKFFKGAFPKTVEQLGIVYTPVECVDFIIRSVDDVLKKEFGVSLADRGVNILDPFTGTGTFVTRTLQYLHSKGISKEDLRHKYLNEIHCNEIVLLSYYVADVNIESVYNDIVQPEKYERYNNICLTDTFQLAESKQGVLKIEGYFKENTEQINRQKALPIRVIIGNPPYSVGQKSANDNAQNIDYPVINERIAETYAKKTSATNKNSLYDSYIKAFRWASDRITESGNKENGGIVAFISNGAWLDGNATEGFRRCIEKEFTDIYVFNLRGNARTSGELRKKEKDSVFGQGTRTPISITILVNNPEKRLQKAKINSHIAAAKLKGEDYQPTDEERKVLDYKHIHYLDIGDYLSREEKLKKVKEIGSVLSKKFGDTTITPNDKGDWINQRGGMFDELMLIGDKDDKTNKKTWFNPVYSCGAQTNRDTWVYNFSKDDCLKSAKTMVDNYNSQVEVFKKTKDEQSLNYDEKYIKWTSSLLPKLRNGQITVFNDYYYRISLYRPFVKSNFYFDTFFIHRPYQIPKLFPTPSHKNLVICVSGVGVTKDFSCIITDHLPDLELIGKSQCFPLYWYESKEDFDKRIKKDRGQLSIDFGEDQTNYDKYGFDEYGYLRHDGVTDYILSEIKKRYSLPANSTAISKEDVFYYIYGILHSKEYRETFAADLKKSLPRIPIVENASDFKAFKEAGQKLANLHLNYENVEPHPDVDVEMLKEDFTVNKMRFVSKEDKSQIIYNDYICIKNIPESAHQYIVNGKSALEWILERYCKSQDKDSLIVNDCNDWALEHNKPRYILDLILSVINVSVQTVDIVNNLPKLQLGDE